MSRVVLAALVVLTAPLIDIHNKDDALRVGVANVILKSTPTKQPSQLP